MKYIFVQGTCHTKWCPNERRKRSPFCNACAAGHHRAEKKGPIWAHMRQDTLSKWQSRIIYVGTEKPTTKKVFNHVARIIRARKAG